MGNPKVSVIIPVYNVEKYLHECLDSVVNQTLTDIEIICVDDGSTDSSLDILQKYAMKDSRVKVLQQQNKYAGVARNRGMSEASGEYYVFLDSDDFFELDLLEKEYNKIVSTGSDICICNADIYDDVKRNFKSVNWLYSDKYVNYGKPICVEEIGDDIYTLTSPSPWNLMFSSGFVKKHGLEFQDTQRANDVYFVLTALNLAERITFINDVLVHYRVGRNGSLQANNAKSPFDFCKALMKVRERLIQENKFDFARRGFINAVVNNCKYNLDTLSDSKNPVFVVLATGIIEKYLDEFEIADKDESYFYDAKNYIAFMQHLYSIGHPKLPKISIIVPVYNVELYLHKCMDSLVKQTLKEIEIICVNDGSTDSSFSILQEYADKDSRIRVINKLQNEGLLLARKSGALTARGRYIVFVDSDDYLAKDACEIAFNLIEKHQVDILQFTCGVEDNSNNSAAKKWLENVLRPEEAFLNGSEIQKDFYLTRKHTTSLLGKVYTTSLCKTVHKYIDNFYCYIGEDIFQFFYYSLLARTFLAVETKPLYWYRYGLGVSNSNIMPLSKFKLYCDMSDLCRRTKRFLIEHDYYDQCYYNYEAMSERMIEDTCKIYLNRINDSDKYAAGEMLCKAWRDNQVADKVFKKMLNVSYQEFVEAHIPTPCYVKECTAYQDTGIKPVVSVIIPVYNVEKYLEECIDSVINQTEKNIEIICVNDGSTDGSLSILEKYYEQDNRVTIISQRNAGLSAARNVGIKYARGQYIQFLDSDDLLELTALDELCDYADENHLDILFFNADSFYEDGEHIGGFSSYDNYYHTKHDYSVPKTGTDLFSDMYENGEYRSSACMQLIRKGHLENHEISFREGIVHEDNLFTFQNILQAKATARVGNAFYKRRIRSDSIMTSRPEFKNFYGYLTCCIEMLSFIMQICIDDRTALNAKSYIESMRKAAEEKYNQLVGIEREKCKNISSLENYWFEILYKKPESSQEKYNNALNEISNIRTSWSYRIGRVITFFPRKIRGGIRCFREHGMRYTLLRAKEKIERLLGGKKR